MGTRLRNRRGAIWTAVAVAAALALAGALASWPFVPGIALIAMALVLVGPAARRVPSGQRRVRRAPRSVEGQAAPARRTLIVGSGEVAQTLARELQAGRRHEVIGFIDDGPAPADSLLPVLGTRDDVLTIAEQVQADQIIIAEAPSWQQQLLERTMSPDRRRLDVQLVPSLYETAIGRLPRQRVNDIPLLAISPWQRSEAYESARRAFDVVFSAAALVITAPLMGFAALLLKLTSPGPVLFRQTRVGLNGQTFTMLKLRTMVLDAERDGPSLCTGYDDRRLTPVGRLLRKTRLDEIPQFYNVLRGEMSVIGPRPERPVFVERFDGQIPGYQERHRIRPGITGLAQVNGHYLSNARDKLRYDLFYLYHRSLWLDASILLRTFTAMIH